VQGIHQEQPPQKPRLVSRNDWEKIKGGGDPYSLWIPGSSHRESPEGKEFLSGDETMQ